MRTACGEGESCFAAEGRVLIFVHNKPEHGLCRRPKRLGGRIPRFLRYFFCAHPNGRPPPHGFPRGAANRPVRQGCLWLTGRIGSKISHPVAHPSFPRLAGYQGEAGSSTRRLFHSFNFSVFFALPLVFVSRYSSSFLRGLARIPFGFSHGLLFSFSPFLCRS